VSAEGSTLTALDTPESIRPERSLARDSASLFAALLVGNAGYFLAVLIVARGLGPEGRGTIAFLVVTSLVLARVARLGVSDATTVFTAQRPGERSVLLANALLFAAVAGALVAVAACGSLILLEDVRPDGLGSAELALLGTATVAAAVVEAGYAFLLGCGRIRPQALVTSSASWIYVALLLIAWWAAGLTVALVALTWMLGQVTRAAMLVSASLRGVGLGRPDPAVLVEAFRFGVRAWFGNLARFLNFRADQVLMGFIASEATLGVYAVSVNASEVLIYLPEAAALALLPQLVTTHDEGRPQRAFRAFRALAALTLVGALVGAAIGPLLIPTVFGPAFDASVLPFLLLLPGAVGYVALGVFSNTLLASGHPGRSSVGALVALTVGLALDLVLIPQFGAAGAASAASVAFLAGGTAALVAYRRRVSFAWSSLLLPRRDDLDVLRALRTGVTLRVRRRGTLRG
jgi:O-antigen/teichoic acid export membrane protein